MSGPAALRSHKGLLSRYINQLTRLLDEYKVTQPETSPVDLVRAQQLRKMSYQLSATSKLVSEALTNFTNVVDALGDTLSEEQSSQTAEYVENAQAVLDKAQSLAIDMEAQLMGAREEAPVTQIAAAKLPAIPIPTFSGRIWEFSNFWTLFDANVHQQPLTKLQKFNYLIASLRGEARELIRRYPVTDSNYDHAVDLLHSKYGDESALIGHLQSRLETTKAESNSIGAQRRLLETIIPIVTQLQDLGVNLDGSYQAQKVLSKFSTALQRRTLESCIAQNMQESDWKIDHVLSILDCLITTEEKINTMVEQNGKSSTPSEKALVERYPSQRNHRTNPLRRCMYCTSTDHTSAACTSIPDLADRRAFLLQHKRCLNCGREGHLLTQCTSRGCRNCEGRKHHHTICPRLSQANGNSNMRRQANQEGTQREGASRPAEPQSTLSNSTRRNGHKPQRGTTNPNLVRSYTVDSAETSNERCPTAAVLHNTERNGGSDHVLLLTGVAKVQDENSRQWKEVEILFDTGADQSFISQKLADDLGLECTEQQEFQVYTFGSQKPTPTRCGVAQLSLRDSNGATHAIRLFTTPVLTAKGRHANLTKEDREFVASHNIQLSKPTDAITSTPEILLGCDQLWDFLNTPLPRFTIPSGLQLIPSKLGYLLSGKQRIPVNTDTRHTEWNVNTLTMSDFANDFEEEMKRWDKYWTMDSAGICEFTGTKNAEKEAVNQQVTEFFNSTIERRQDGYYVRLPYKSDHPPLPNNKNIAVKRLHSVVNMLRNNELLMKDYDNTFKEQLRQGIIEEVRDEPTSKDRILHYIPHQPVVTPQKDTTKLRIVFDASSHYKECPSLNDVLHQGPLILPDLYGLLIRFRSTQYVAISDVEKAFLQVRLNERDRDATRFLWLKDIHAPITEDNMTIFRFTRVTFGLNVSPFLLAGTIYYHLEHEVEDKKLSQDIRDNLYVDNVILGSNDPEELGAKASTARRIFTDMQMNLREFLSNTDSLEKYVPPQALTSSTTQKVLGIVWDARKDCLEMSTSFPDVKVTTKRLVARQIASIYDPLGWLVPLLTPLKHFQQRLWREKFEWDTQLPESFTAEWNDLTKNANKFKQEFSRAFPTIADQTKLAVFADASERAMATCAYLFDHVNSCLVMARGKLPSIRSSSTIPKLEMNAITMAARLAWSVYRALQKSLQKPREVLIFSDSQIALNWLALPVGSSTAGVLVKNRVKEIREIVKAFNEEGISVRFGYVNTKENPADAGTRGLTQDQLQDDELWWRGPRFLVKPESEWDTTFYPCTEKSGNKAVVDAFVINATLTCMQGPEPFVDLNRVSSFMKAKRITARALLFLSKLIRSLADTSRNRIYENIPELRHISSSVNPRAEDMKAARLLIIRNHQMLYLSKEYRKSMDNTLRLFSDQDKIWRSRGRLGNTTLRAEAKSPIFIAPNTKLAWLIIQEAHEPYHRGVEHSIATVRQTYWIPKVRQQTRKLVQQCVKCRRFNALPYAYPEATDLPERRVYRCRPFEHIGLDFFDLPRPTENPDSHRYYGCIFTCTVTRLMHLEMLESMSTVDFINALRRFVSRRGLPTSITCDNAPTFLLSSSLLPKNSNNVDLNEDIERVLAEKEIQWKHITPYAPWQGGFYERLIKSVKHALYKALRGSAERHGDHLRTVITEIEACLNSRPLTYQGADQEELSSIRPVDFLQRDIDLTLPLEHLISPSDQDQSYVPPEEIRTLQTTREVREALKSSYGNTERFWRIWREQYLTSLREKQKTRLTDRRQSKTIPKVGDIVLVNDPILPRNDWKMARITEVKKGTNDDIREVGLVTSTRRKIRRPVNLITPLEITPDRTDLQSTDQQDEVNGSREYDEAAERRTTSRYDLRPRRPINYAEQTVNAVVTPNSTYQTSRWFLFHLM
ncbi:hypothetical protein Q1695_007220 [Nippostrongylus brasiliensis]|nr:hypothetical protein Q1695_007220 [Nippostrongylus brasiliensis]